MSGRWIPTPRFKALVTEWPDGGIRLEFPTVPSSVHEVLYTHPLAAGIYDRSMNGKIPHK